MVDIKQKKTKRSTQQNLRKEKVRNKEKVHRFLHRSKPWIIDTMMAEQKWNSEWPTFMATNQHQSTSSRRWVIDQCVEKNGIWSWRVELVRVTCFSWLIDWVLISWASWCPDTRRNHRCALFFQPTSPCLDIGCKNCLSFWIYCIQHKPLSCYKYGQLLWQAFIDFISI